MTTNPVVDIILWRTLAIFLLVGAATGIIVSLLMIFRPALFECVNRVANRWVSTRRMNKLVDRGISLEQWFYRHHRVLGALVCLGAIYVFVHFGLLFDKAAALPHLASHLPARLNIKLLDGLLDALVLASLTGATVSLFVGLLLGLRPSMLRGLEETANLWVTSRRATRFLDIPRDQVDEFVMRHTPRFGWLLLLGSLYLFFLTFRILA